MIISKSLLPRIELIFWIQHYFDQVGSIEKSNSHDLIKKLVLVLCKFTLERWTAIQILTLMNSQDVVTILTVYSNVYPPIFQMILGAQCKAVAVEAGMLALRRDAEVINHEDFMEAIIEVQAKKKANLQYYA